MILVHRLCRMVKPGLGTDYAGTNSYIGVKCCARLIPTVLTSFKHAVK